MKLIVGLGNPGEKYQNTRHNVGFMVLDKVLEKKGFIPFRLENQFKAAITQTGGIGEDRIILAKPNTFMNNSGEAVSKLMSYYKIGSDDLVEIKDDLDLPVGTIRIKDETSSGGHRGSESITKALGSNDRTVIKIGIGSNREQNLPAEDYVLQDFTKAEKDQIDKSIDKAADLVINYIINGTVKEETINI